MSFIRESGSVCRRLTLVRPISVLGGQAIVEGVEGTWKTLTADVNNLAGNLTTQVRAISSVTKAVAAGDLSRKIDVEASGEIQILKVTINSRSSSYPPEINLWDMQLTSLPCAPAAMVDQLRTFADEVIRVALSVGTEGILGGQAVVPGVSGTWKVLTETVNQMASNLTTQVVSAKPTPLLTRTRPFGC